MPTTPFATEETMDSSQSSSPVRYQLARSQRGLTLIEIIIAIVIIGTISGFLYSKVSEMRQKASVQSSKLKMKSLQQDILIYLQQNNQLPQNLQAIGTDQENLKDSFGGQIQYRPLDGGRAYELSSLGADGKPGGSGVDADIVEKGP